MATVTIDSIQYDVYADVGEAMAYLQASYPVPSFMSADAADQARMLVAATRLLDRQCWLGDKTDVAQVLQWPRTSTGVTGVEDDEIPLDIINGAIELASAISEGSEAQSKPIPGLQDIQTLSAGSVSLTWFRGAEGQLAFARFPLPVQELVGKYMCGSVGIGGVRTFGTDGESVTEQDFGYNDGI